MTPTRVLFVCLGNICRSPLAEGVFRALAAREGLAEAFIIDSAGTGDWHVGERPDRRAIEAAARRGIDIAGQRARQATAEDLARFDHVLAMDTKNLDALQRLARGGGARPRLFLDHARGVSARDVPDPYFDGGFEAALDLIEAGARGLLLDLRDETALRQNT